MTLSGFLFARISEGKNIDYKGFLLNRVLRIYPLFTCVLLLAVYLEPARNGILAFLSSMLCLHNGSSAVMHPTMTPHLWSIAVEFQFYLLFPLLLKFKRLRGMNYLFLLIGLAIACRALVYVATHDARTLAYMTLFGRIDQFLIGMILGFAYPRLANYVKHPALLVLAGVATTAALSFFHAKGGFFNTGNGSIWIVWTTIEAILWGSVILTYCASSMRIAPAFSKSLSFLGTLSFSLYVNHYFLANMIPGKVIPFFEKLASGHGFLAEALKSILALDYWACVLLTPALVLPATILVSLVTYYAIEKPFMDMRVKYTTALE